MELEQKFQDAIRASTTPEVEIAGLIHSDKMLRRFLDATKPKDRRAAYKKLKPLLDFKPKAYFLLMQGKVQEEEQGMAKLTCQSCPAKDFVHAVSAVDAAIQARDKGWKLIAGMMFCTKCSTRN